MCAAAETCAGSGAEPSIQARLAWARWVQTGNREGEKTHARGVIKAIKLMNLIYILDNADRMEGRAGGSVGPVGLRNRSWFGWPGSG